MNRLQANQVYITLEGVNSSPQMLKHSVRISLNQMDENDRRLIREAVKDIRRSVHAHHAQLGEDGAIELLHKLGLWMVKNSILEKPRAV